MNSLADLPRPLFCTHYITRLESRVRPINDDVITRLVVWYVCHYETPFYRPRKASLLASALFASMEGNPATAIFSPPIKDVVSEPRFLFAPTYDVLAETSSCPAHMRSCF